MARVKKNIEFSPGLVVEVLRMTLTDKTAVDAVTKFFNTDLTTSGTVVDPAPEVGDTTLEGGNQ